GARQRERLARVAGVGRGDGGQRVEMKLPGDGKIVANIVGVLLSKPDRVICCYLNTHDAVTTMWRRDLLKCLGARVKHGERIAPHFSNPEPSLVVNGQPHHLAVRLWKGILAKRACCFER